MRHFDHAFTPAECEADYAANYVPSAAQARALGRELPADGQTHHVVLVGKGSRTAAVFIDGKMVRATWAYRLRLLRRLLLRGGATIHGWVGRHA